MSFATNDLGTESYREGRKVRVLRVKHTADFGLVTFNTIFVSCF